MSPHRHWLRAEPGGFTPPGPPVGYFREEEAGKPLVTFFWQTVVAVQAGTPMTAGGEGTPSA